MHEQAYSLKGVSLDHDIASRVIFYASLSAGAGASLFFLSGLFTRVLRSELHPASALAS